MLPGRSTFDANIVPLGQRGDFRRVVDVTHNLV